MNAIQVTLFLIIIAILINFIRKRRNKKFYELLEQFPSHPNYPLIGNAHMLFGSLEGGLKKFEKILQPFDRQIYWLGPIPCLLLKKHDDIATILNQCLHRDTLGIIDDWLGVGLLSSDYEEWKKSKKIIAPAFSSNMLSKYVDVLNKNASNLVEELKSVANTDEQIDVFHWMMKTNLNAITETALGVDIRNSGKQGKEFCDAVLKGIQHGSRRIQYPILLFNFFNKIYLKMMGKIEVINHIKHLPAEILRKKLDKYDFQGEIGRTCGDNGENTLSNSGLASAIYSSETILDLLIEKNSEDNALTEIRMRDELLQLIIAGVETNALTLSFLMLMLAMNQDIQQKAYEEIIELITDDEILSETCLNNNLMYLELCIKETLRMFCPVMVTTRRTHNEITLKNNMVVPKGIFVAAFIHFANYDPDLYENPEKFDPEHFSNETVEKRPKTSQLSFGYGPRTCIGMKFAMKSVKTQMAYILRNYHLSTDIKEFTKDHLTADLGIKSKIGYPIRFTTR